MLIFSYYPTLLFKILYQFIRIVSIFIFLIPVYLNCTTAYYDNIPRSKSYIYEKEIEYSDIKVVNLQGGLKIVCSLAQNYHIIIGIWTLKKHCRE